MTALLGLLGGLWGKVAAGGAALVAVLAGLAAVRRSGGQAQRLADANQRERDRVQSDRIADEVADVDAADVHLRVHRYDRRE